VDGCAVTPDGAYALSISRDGTAKLWDLAARRCTQTLSGFAAPLLSCSLSPDSQRAVLAREDGPLEVRNLQSQQLLHELRGHEARVFGCAVSPDGARVVSASEDGTLRVWSLETGQCLATLQGTSWFRCVAVANGLICAGDQEGNLWMVHDGTAMPGAQPPVTPPALPAPGMAPGAPQNTPPARPAPGVPVEALVSHAPAGPRDPDAKFRSGAQPRPSIEPEAERRPPVVPATSAPPAPEVCFPVVAIASLRNVLATLYGSTRLAAMIATDAGLNVTLIALQGSPQECWFEILRVAWHQGRIERVVRRAQQDYPEHDSLLAAARALDLV
jgi:hypothetical protein